MTFKPGQIVECKIAGVTEICTVVDQVIRDNQIRYQIKYPLNSSSYQYWTEQDAKDLKESSWDKFRKN